MKCCYQCQSELSKHQFASGLCPKCGADLTQVPHPEGWTSIARFGSLAEVGYFADILTARDLETEIRQHHQFSALDGSWQTSYYLQVPQTAVDQATEALKRELEEMEASESWSEQPGEDLPQDGLASPGVWRPVVMVLMAGGIAYCAGRSTMDQVPNVPPRQTDLWQAITESRQPLESTARPDGPRRRLQFDPPTDSVLLEEDRDGDGQFERRRWYRAGRLVKEAVD